MIGLGIWQGHLTPVVQTAHGNQAGVRRNDSVEGGASMSASGQLGAFQRFICICGASQRHDLVKE